MKKIIIILITFTIAILTTLLFEWSFIANNIVRYILVILLVAFEVLFGMHALKVEILKSLNNKNEQ